MTETQLNAASMTKTSLNAARVFDYFKQKQLGCGKTVGETFRNNDDLKKTLTSYLNTTTTASEERIRATLDNMENKNAQLITCDNDGILSMNDVAYQDHFRKKGGKRKKKRRKPKRKTKRKKRRKTKRKTKRRKRRRKR